MGIKSDAHASYKLLSEEFKKHGYDIAEYSINGRTRVTYRSSKGKIWDTAASNISYPFNSRFVRDCSRNKEIASKYVLDKGMPIPKTLHIQPNIPFKTELLRLLADHSIIVVKPSDASLSRGLTTNISDIDTAVLAVAHARQFSASVVAQQQVVGKEVRFAVINGKVVAALLRQTPFIVGDGHMSIRKLIENENSQRKHLAFPYISYPQLDNTLIDADLISNEDILGAGVILKLSGATMIKNGCSIYNVLDAVHQSYVDQVEKIAHDLNAGFIVMDVFIQDYTTESSMKNHWFIEFNTAPVLKLFYGCRDGNQYDIVPELVNHIDAHIHKN